MQTRWPLAIRNWNLAAFLLLSLAGDTVGQSVVAGASNGDPEVLTNPVPHPYIALGPALMSGGYAPLAYRAEVGIDLESTHAIIRALAAYDNGHKINDNDQPNPEGPRPLLGNGSLLSFPRQARRVVRWHGLALEPAFYDELHQGRDEARIRWRLRPRYSSL